ncbi:lysozyme [Laribacter hongkongensis]|uniref:Lysozyme n=1 Tax=Laribacter hongkongensis TaxID=168471 RepID=A0ABD4SN80_9NEIS|nr:lysozyme [Laribacter hongkongensis]MCG9025180.1 lysozyme [Laribacter hongkongensis]MCG9099768.1 lysozyme [Laribacter hongkongensis]MCG9103430.1 lysozyme [Laribacter hongkongensis]MCG9111246.1 lysozyme [Laribacter hongkongensis]MCG9118598.1 lysozyme [Laribacter hongkongensis]
MNRAIQIIKVCEGLELTAYRCPAGILTIGYGHTGPDVTEGQTITERQADGLLQNDIQRIAVPLADAIERERARQRLPLLTAQSRDALVSLAFNCPAALNWRPTKTDPDGSTLARLLVSEAAPYRAPASERIRREWLRWCYAGGKALPGLKIRRETELDLFFCTR